MYKEAVWGHPSCSHHGADIGLIIPRSSYLEIISGVATGGGGLGARAPTQNRRAPQEPPGDLDKTTVTHFE